MVKRSHGIEEVGYHCCTSVHGREGLLVGCIRVADGDGYSAFGEGGDTRESAGKFGGYGYNFDLGEIGGAVAVR